MSTKLCGFYPLILALACCAFPTQSWSITTPKKVTAALKKVGVIVVPCPRYIALPASGLYTSIQRSDTVCINGARGKKAQRELKRYIRKSFTLDGKLRGSTFQPISQQEGDVNSDPFQVVNYPAIVQYEMTNAGFGATYSLSIIDALNDNTLSKFERGRVPAAGAVTWVGAGSFYFKTAALPDQEAEQPTFNVSMRFMDEYVGEPISLAEMRENGAKMTRCPNIILDIHRKQQFALKKYVCAKTATFEDAGLSPAPFNLTQGLYLSLEASPDVLELGGQGLPFRVTRPTRLTYIVEDPATADEKKGSTRISLINISTGTRKLLASVQGNIAETTTFINIPGDYIVSVDTKPKEPAKYGNIVVETAVVGSD